MKLTAVIKNDKIITSLMEVWPVTGPAYEPATLQATGTATRVLLEPIPL